MGLVKYIKEILADIRNGARDGWGAGKRRSNPVALPRNTPSLPSCRPEASHHLTVAPNNGKAVMMPSMVEYQLLPKNDQIILAKSYGDAYGNCMFCNRPLTDARSKAAGYGKTCAARMGLPWGSLN